MVVIDRYIYSGIVYSAAKQNPNLSLEWARAPEVGLPQPDLCLFLDIKDVEAAKRGGFGNERYETTAMQTRVRELFTQMMASPDGRVMQVLDAGRSVQEVEREVLERVMEVMKSPALASPIESIPP